MDAVPVSRIDQDHHAVEQPIHRLVRVVGLAAFRQKLQHRQIVEMIGEAVGHDRPGHPRNPGRRKSSSESPFAAKERP